MAEEDGRKFQSLSWDEILFRGVDTAGINWVQPQLKLDLLTTFTQSLNFGLIEENTRPPPLAYCRLQSQSLHVLETFSPYQVPNFNCNPLKHKDTPLPLIYFNPKI